MCLYLTFFLVLIGLIAFVYIAGYIFLFAALDESEEEGISYSVFLGVVGGLAGLLLFISILLIVSIVMQRLKVLF